VTSVVAQLPRLEVESREPMQSGDPGPVLQRWEDNDRRLIATGGGSPDDWWVHWHGLATFRFGEAGPVRARLVDPALEPQVRDLFSRAIVPMALLARGFEALHASAVIAARGVVGLCGLSGTGKSTLAMALSVHAGLPHFADDALVYRVADGEPIGIRIPFPVRVEATALATADNRSTSQPPAGQTNGRALWRIYQLVRDESVDPGFPKFAAVPSENRFTLLLSHAHPFDLAGPQRRRQFVENVMALARQVDVWECRFAPELTALPALARAVRDHMDQE
jgi:hypothetical protein